MSPVEYPELGLLAEVLGDAAAWLVAQAPGGWRTLSTQELKGLGVSARTCRQVVALQELSSRGRPVLTAGELGDSDAVARVYSARLGALHHEVVIGVALDSRNRVIGEVELATGGRHGAALTAADVFRPIIRTGASGFLLVHNHPSGDPRPSLEDIVLTRVISRLGAALGMQLVDHVIVTADDHVSLFERGLMEEQEHEQGIADQAVPA